MLQPNLHVISSVSIPRHIIILDVQPDMNKAGTKVKYSVEGHVKCVTVFGIKLGLKYVYLQGRTIWK